MVAGQGLLLMAVARVL